MSDADGLRVRVIRSGENQHRWEVYYDDMHAGNRVVAAGAEDLEREAWLSGLIAKEQQS